MFITCQFPAILGQFKRFLYRNKNHMSRHHSEPSLINSEEALVRSYFHLDPLLTDYAYHDDCCFSPDGQTFAVVSNSNVISFFKCDGCKYENKIANKKYGCSKVCYHQDKSKNALYLNSKNENNDHAARLLNIQQQGFIRYFSNGGHSAPITSLCPTSNGLITSSQDRTIKFWDDSTERSTTTLEVNHPANIALHPNGLCMAVTTDSALYIYDTRNLDKYVANIKISAKGDKTPYFGMRGTKLAIVGDDFAQEYNMSDLSYMFSLDMTMSKQTPGFAFTPDEEFLLIPTNDYSILVADTGEGSQVTVLSGHRGSINSISFSSAFHNFVSVGRECLYWTIDIPTYNMLINQEE
ncbi:hypothetical protein TRFO_27505 [Tritrichomonas foetus]|uniref:Uncharacterized protein n=1 Tax=Tritrichomonas foetus TaxID=1144522 RepID=A0A1J4K602_9EUKA|nr:hypothetical protein TRFO_27505 [Tritrichomonas foetus]|eukprot:OHT04893.1 hypothetical protein TRFO_27505 [Tritrichomonas foetus]